MTIPALDLTAATVFVALGGVVLVATRRRPADAIVALIATAPFDYAHGAGATTITFAKVALVAALLGIALRRPLLATLARPPARGIALAMLAVCCATLFSIVVAADRGPTLRETLKAVEYLLTFAVAALAWRLDPDVPRLRLAFLIVTTVVCVLALAQEFTGATSGIWYNGKAFPRIAGPLEGPNQLAGYLGIVLPFVALYAAPVTALGAATLVLTLSRSGAIACFIALAIVLALQPHLRRRVLAAIGGGIAAAAVVLVGWHVGGVGSRFISFAEVEHSGGVGTRSILWNAAISLWKRSPLLGVGAGNFEILLPTVAPPGIRTHANSWYLQSLVEGGIPLLAATLALVWSTAVGLARALRNPLCLAAFAASVAFALHGIVDLLIFFPKVAITWFVMLGIAASEAEARP